jgi:hypothetical protein
MPIIVQVPYLGEQPLGVGFDPDAAAWFTAVEAAGSTFNAGAKTAYNDFFISEKANGNLAAFENGMLLAFAGFTGLNGCFVPLKSRGGALPTNTGFVSGNKVSDGLQGNGSAYINCVIGFLSGQRDNCTFGVWGNTLAESLSAAADFGNSAGGPTGSIQLVERADVNNDVFVRASTSSLSTGLTRQSGGRFVVRNSSSEYQYFFNAGSTSIAVMSQELILAAATIFARAAASVTNRRLQLAFFGDALPDPAAFRTATNTLMTALGVII